MLIHKSDKSQFGVFHLGVTNRDQSTVGADHPGLPASVDRCPNPSDRTLNSHRL